MTSQIKLLTSDYEEFSVDRDVIERSVVIKHMLEDIGQTDHPIPLLNVSATVLAKVLEYCEHYRGEPMPMTTRTTDPAEWDQNFFSVDQEMLFDIILAANYLEIIPLLNLGCKIVANMIKGKTPSEIRATFNIVNDFTPEEEAQIERENEWCENDSGLKDKETFDGMNNFISTPDSISLNAS